MASPTAFPFVFAARGPTKPLTLANGPLQVGGYAAASEVRCVAGDRAVAQRKRHPISAVVDAAAVVPADSADKTSDSATRSENATERRTC